MPTRSQRSNGASSPEYRQSNLRNKLPLPLFNIGRFSLSTAPCSHQATRSYLDIPSHPVSSRKLPLQVRGKPLLLKRTIQFGLKSSRRLKDKRSEELCRHRYSVAWAGRFWEAPESPGLNVSTGATACPINTPKNFPYVIVLKCIICALAKVELAILARLHVN